MDDRPDWRKWERSDCLGCFDLGHLQTIKNNKPYFPLDLLCLNKLFEFRHKTEPLNKKKLPWCSALIHISAWLCGSINSGQARVRSSLQLLSIKAFCSACSSVGNSFLFQSSTSQWHTLTQWHSVSRPGWWKRRLGCQTRGSTWRRYGILCLVLKFGWVGRVRSFLLLPQTNEVQRQHTLSYKSEPKQSRLTT